jgi:hypothetical protein
MNELHKARRRFSYVQALVANQSFGESEPTTRKGMRGVDSLIILGKSPHDRQLEILRLLQEVAKGPCLRKTSW